MRRGGRFLYAFDVTSPTNPVLLWRKSHADFPVLGQTWSDARVALVRGHADPVLVMGAGYDAAAEDPASPGTPVMGNAVLVLDALSGTLVKSFPTDRPVPAAVAVLDADFDGYTDRGYAVDLGGNVYRIDFENALGGSAPVDWRIGKFADLGDAARSRKFFSVPDLVQTLTFTAILVGSGDREKPLAPYYPPASVTNDRFYTLLDRSTAKGNPGLPAINESQLSVNGTTFTGAAGCYLPLDSAGGEKVVTSAATTGGYTYFSTNTPTSPFSTNSCNTQLGIAKSYRVPVFCGQAESQEFVGGGLPPSPVIGFVEVQVTVSGPGGPSEETKQVPFIIGGFNAQLSGLQASRVPVNVDPTRRRTYWFTNKGH
jgi:type IV pilus assembly protein PilY1